MVTARPSTARAAVPPIATTSFGRNRTSSTSSQKRQAWISGASGVLWMRRLPRGSNLKCFTALVM